METKSDTFFKCTSTLFKIIYHLSLSIPNTRSTHMHVDFWTKFQWSSSNKRPYLWSLKGANIQGRHGYTVSPTKVYDGSLPASQYWPIADHQMRSASLTAPGQPKSKAWPSAWLSQLVWPAAMRRGWRSRHRSARCHGPYHDCRSDAAGAPAGCPANRPVYAAVA